jgi:hypothetical protein
MGVIVWFCKKVGVAVVNVKTSFSTAKGTVCSTLSKPSFAMTVAVMGDTKVVGTPEKVMVVPLEVTVGGEIVIPPCANPVVVNEMG